MVNSSLLPGAVVVALLIVGFNSVSADEAKKEPKAKKPELTDADYARTSVIPIQVINETGRKVRVSWIGQQRLMLQPGQNGVVTLRHAMGIFGNLVNAFGNLECFVFRNAEEIEALESFKGVGSDELSHYRVVCSEDLVAIFVDHELKGRDELLRVSSGAHGEKSPFRVIWRILHPRDLEELSRRAIDKIKPDQIVKLLANPTVTPAHIANGYRGEPKEGDDVDGHFIDPEGKGRKDSDYPWDSLGPIWGFKELTKEGLQMKLPKTFDRRFLVVPHVLTHAPGSPGCLSPLTERCEAAKKKDSTTVCVNGSDPVGSWPCQLTSKEQHDMTCGGDAIPLTREQIRIRLLGRKYGKR